MFRPLDKLAPPRALPQHPREIGLAEHVAEKGLGVAGDPAVALRDRAFGIQGDELVGTVFLPNARQPRGRTGALFFMNDSALGCLHRSGGWELGTGPSIVVVDKGLAKSLSTSTVREGVYAFFFAQKGLMAGLGLQGSKITEITPNR